MIQEMKLVGMKKVVASFGRLRRCDGRRCYGWWTKNESNTNTKEGLGGVIACHGATTSNAKFNGVFRPSLIDTSISPEYSDKGNSLIKMPETIKEIWIMNVSTPPWLKSTLSSRWEARSNASRIPPGSIA